MIFVNSRYTGARAYIDETTSTVYAGFECREIPAQEGDIMYQFKQGDRLDLLAKNYYGSTQLKWIILYANPTYMTEFDIQVGDYIRIPHPDRSDLK